MILFRVSVYVASQPVSQSFNQSVNLASKQAVRRSVLNFPLKSFFCNRRDTVSAIPNHYAQAGAGYGRLFQRIDYSAPLVLDGEQSSWLWGSSIPEVTQLKCEKYCEPC